ncbi:MAG: prepilin-type N-terminal cleavage/methylation domain-containing protein, partial [Cyanobacteria bacterium SIG32]|nr:prepilin-type N-terminal cleavage/methylation domain-containing protein [Cyanobacteria bacterium SIG32]
CSKSYRHPELVSGSITKPINRFRNKFGMTPSGAFTLAEVLITLAIIGVVAAMTIPTLVANYQQRSWDTASSVFNRRLGEALKIMNANSSLAGFESTADFVEELGKHIKITKTCSSDKLTDCFTSEILTTADPVETSKLKASKNLYSTTDYGTETIGVMFGDGTSALIAYNKNATEDPYSNTVVRFSGGRDSVAMGTDAVSILYDVNGLKTPNEMDTGKDIRGLNIAIKTGAAIKNLGTISTPVDCSTTASTSTDAKIKADYDAYCGPTPSGYSSDYWAGAKRACVDEGMHLPTLQELRDLYARKGEEGIPTSGYYWSSSQDGIFSARVLTFANGSGGTSRSKGNSGSYVLCLGN